jgi:hypothetical protein
MSPLARLQQLISHSHTHNIQSYFTYMTHNASLLSMIFTAVRLLYIIMSYDDSHFVTELNEFECSKIRESRNVNISICWMKIRSARSRGRTVWANRWRDLWRRQRHYWLGRKASSIWVTRDRLRRIFRMSKLSFNRDRRSTSHFKTFSGFQKVNSLTTARKISYRHLKKEPFTQSRWLGGWNCVACSHPRTEGTPGSRLSPVPDGTGELQLDTANPCPDLAKLASLYPIVSDGVSAVLANFVTNRNGGLSDDRRRETLRSSGRLWKVTVLFHLARSAIAFTECADRDLPDKWLPHPSIWASFSLSWDNRKTGLSENGPRHRRFSPRS